jgi:hypothetical protein
MVSFYIQRDYVAQNLCKNRFERIPICKGSCFLEEQINNQENKEQNLPESKVKEIQLFIQAFCKIELVGNRKSEKNYPYFKKEFLELSDFLFSVFHPPQFA